MRKVLLTTTWTSELIIAISALAFFGGCASTIGHRQLEKVAKDWCYAIRASQVMPVYPLTEDLRPGDVFLVQTTLQDQARIWKDRGFLPLDDQRARLDKVDYTKMYFNSYWKDEFGGDKIPHPRPALTNAGPITPPAGGAPADPAIDPAPEAMLARASSNVEAPRAAFPTYSFEADASSGFSLAVPVHAVPVGLNFMNASKATGSIAIADAYTYSADSKQLFDAVGVWADTDDIRMMLQAAYRQVNHVVYLRVVTRVYLTGAVAVSLTNANRNAGDIKAGADVDVPLIKENGTLNDTAYNNLLTALDNQAMKAFPVNAAGKLIPGGAIKFAFASRRAVSMSEAFDRPLAIGFLGFDVPVDEHGNIGYPIPTFQVVKGDVVPSVERMDTLKPLESETNIRLFALDGVWNQPNGADKTACIIANVSDRLDAKVFAEPMKMAKEALKKGSSDPAFRDAVNKAKDGFESTLRWTYLVKGAGTGRRYDRFISIFDKAFNECNKE